MYNLRKNTHHREIRKCIEGLVDKEDIALEGY